MTHPDLPGDADPFDQTARTPSRWDQDGAEYVKDNAEWVARCPRRIAQLHPAVGMERAHDLAQDASLDDGLRAKSPEVVSQSIAAD